MDEGLLTRVTDHFADALKFTKGAAYVLSLGETAGAQEYAELARQAAQSALDELDCAALKSKGKQ